MKLLFFAGVADKMSKLIIDYPEACSEAAKMLAELFRDAHKRDEEADERMAENLRKTQRVAR